MAAATMKACPACHAEFPLNAMGRPRRFCSDACRRVLQIRAELPTLEAELEDARVKAGHWAQKEYWTSHVRALELAVAEAQMRLAEDR